MAGMFRELVIKDPRLPGREKGLGGKTLHPRSPQWPAFRKRTLKKKRTCIACGKTASQLLAAWTMQLHHIIPFHLDPTKELDEDNVEPLCGNPRCHLGDGHLGNFKKWNPFVREMCALRRKLKDLAPKTLVYDPGEFITLATQVASWAASLQEKRK
jgi:hypothetical protein